MNGEASRRVTHNSGREEWHTPPVFVDAARRVMGRITLDPATSIEAQRHIRADRYYTRDDDGLAHDWSGESVWMNPPYSGKVIGKFIDKVIAEPAQAVVLVNNATETRWCQALLGAYCVGVFRAGRIGFLRPGETVGNGTPVQGQIIVGIRVDVNAFAREYAPMGRLFCPHD